MRGVNQVRINYWNARFALRSWLFSLNGSSMGKLKFRGLGEARDAFDISFPFVMYVRTYVVYTRPYRYLSIVYECKLIR